MKLTEQEQAVFDRMAETVLDHKDFNAIPIETALDMAAFVPTLLSMVLRLSKEPEVVHARWEWDKNGSGGAYCTGCKRVMNPVLYGYSHCALCGARMDADAPERGGEDKR